MSKEIWKDIKNYEGLYQISNFGRVKSLVGWNVQNGYKEREYLLKPFSQGKYEVIVLRKNKQRKNHYIHRLVAEAFCEKKENANVVNHLDFNTFNNASDNLEWVTQKENVVYSIERMRKPKRITHPKSGIKGIYFRPNRNVWCLVIGGKEYGTYKNIDEAIKRKGELLNEQINY